MTITVSPGGSDFRNIINYGSYYVDKTKFLSTLLDARDIVTLITLLEGLAKA